MERWQLQPTQADRWVANRIVDHATPVVERYAKVLTLAADERPLVAISAAIWVMSRLSTSKESRKAADQLAANILVTSILPHILKRSIARERPDRRVVHGARSGIPRSGHPEHAFPSGHAMHVGAFAASCSRFFPRLRPLVWMMGAS